MCVCVWVCVFWGTPGNWQIHWFCNHRQFPIFTWWSFPPVRKLQMRLCLSAFFSHIFFCFFFLNFSAHLFVCFLVTCKKVTCPDAPLLCEGVPLFSPSPPWAPSRTIHGSWTLGNHSHVFINHRFTQHVADFGRQFYPQYSKDFVHQFLRMRLTAAPPHCEKKKKTFKIVKVVLVGILKVRPAPANSPAGQS